MKKQITILLGILMIASVLAIYAGESETITLPEDFDYYSIIGNESPVELEIQQDGLNITITPSKYTKDESFEIIFFNKEKETITITETIHTGGGGGGSSRTRYVDRNVTVYSTDYIDRELINEVEVEVEKIVDKIEYVDNGYKIWHVVVAVITSLIIAYIILLYLNRDKDEENTPSEYIEREEERE